MSRVPVLEISQEEREELIRRVRAHKSSQRDAIRAKVILLCSKGVPLVQIGKQVGMDQHYVSRWRKRFLVERLSGLEDKTRTGRPRRLGHDERMRMAAIATSAKDPDDPVATWNYADVAEVLRAEDIEVSVSQVWRILTSMDIDLTKVRGWLNRRDDPDFWERVRDVCGLYLNCPDNAIVVSVDEKTSMQAKERKTNDQPPSPGKLARREWEYTRHGTASVFAALNVHAGDVVAKPIPGSNDSVNFCNFLAQIEESVDSQLEIHVVLDNGSSHRSKYTRQWFSLHPRWVVHYTPPHASWVNQIELFFSILQRKVIANGNFTSVQDLIDKILAFVAKYDETAKPFKWTYAADPLVV